MRRPGSAPEAAALNSCVQCGLPVPSGDESGFCCFGCEITHAAGGGKGRFEAGSALIRVVAGAFPAPMLLTSALTSGASPANTRGSACRNSETIKSGFGQTRNEARASAVRTIFLAPVCQ